MDTQRIAAMRAGHIEPAKDLSKLPILGSGKYGRVYELSDTMVVKQVLCPARGDQSIPATPGCERSIKQAYREVMAGTLVTLLVLRRICPHFVTSYGGCSNRQSDGKLCMMSIHERFQGALCADKARAVLASKEDWVSMIFQLSHAVLSCSEAFSIVHCDIYPQNILWRRNTGPPLHIYKVHGVYYKIPVRTIFALADFGICASKWFDAEEGPEVRDTLKMRPCLKPYGDTQLHRERHVLHYNLPVFSRDLYCIWKLPGSGGLPPLPEALAPWVRYVLEVIDRSCGSLHDSSGILGVFRAAFKSLVVRDEPREPDIPVYSIDAEELNHVRELAAQAVSMSDDDTDIQIKRNGESQLGMR